MLDLKIVVDTNVLISGIFFGGKPEKVLKLCFKKEITAYVTDEIVTEYRRVVREMQQQARRKFSASSLENFILNAEIIVNKEEIEVCRDHDDDKFIECAVSANALYIVSGDKDLLDLEKYANVKILTASEFLKLQSK